jgi:hypothetical protein
VIPIALEDNASAGIAAIEKKVKSLITPKVMEIQADIKTSMKSGTASGGSKNITANRSVMNRTVNRSVTNRTVSYNQYGVEPTSATRPVTQYPISDALNTHKLLSAPIATKQLEGLEWAGQLTGITGLSDGAKQTGIFGRKIGRRLADDQTNSRIQLSRISPNQLGGTNFMTRFGSNFINNGIRQSELFGAGITGSAGNSTAGQVGHSMPLIRMNEILIWQQVRWKRPVRRLVRQSGQPFYRESGQRLGWSWWIDWFTWGR